MKRRLFKAIPSSSPHLFPEDIYAKIPLNHPVRLVSSVVDDLDISSVLSLYKGGGNSSYHPRMMLKVLFYSYLSNIYSCRKMEKALEENIHFMWLSGNSTPDFRTINRFRGERLKGQIDDLFTQIVQMLSELGYVSLEVQYIDGTKIESVANKYTFTWRKRVEKDKAKLEAKIQGILQGIDQAIQQDNQAENEEKLPKKIDSEELKERLSILNKGLKKKSEAQQKAELKALKELQTKHLPRLERYEQDLVKLGNRNSYSKTDVDATFMRMKEDAMKNGQLKPAYNVQISTENQFITHFGLHQKPNDTTTLLPHLEGFKERYKQASEEVVADAGYGSEENYAYLDGENTRAFVKYNLFHQEQKRKFQRDISKVENLYYNAENDWFICPMGQKMTRIRDFQRPSSTGYIQHLTHYQAQDCSGCPLRGTCHKAQGNRTIQVNHTLRSYRQKAKENLLSEKGRFHRGKRCIEPEAVFGQLKHNNGFKRFTMKGLEKTNLEFALHAIGHNLRKWTKKLANPRPTTPTDFFAPFLDVFLQLFSQSLRKINPLKI